MVDLIYDKSGKPYSKAKQTAAGLAAQKEKDATYWAWVEAKMQRTFKGTLAEFREAQEPSDLAERTVRQLRVIARERNVRGRSTMRKLELVAAIKKAGLPNEAGPLLKAMMDGAA